MSKYKPTMELRWVNVWRPDFKKTFVFEHSKQYDVVLEQKYINNENNKVKWKPVPFKSLT